jgi:hypothetical protein
MEFCGQGDDGHVLFGQDFASLLAGKFGCSVAIVVRSRAMSQPHAHIARRFRGG